MSRFLFIVLLFLISCNGKKEEFIDFDDLSPDSKNKSKEIENKSTKNYVFADSLSDFTKQIIDSFAFDKTQITEIDTNFFPDRFGASSSEKWYLKTEKDSLVFYHWKFSDSIKTFNTFYNWLDCFGSKCKSIRVGEKVSFSKRAICFFVENTDLYYIEASNLIDYEKFMQVFDEKDSFKKMKFVVIQKARKKAEWFSRDSEGVLVPFKELNL
jgi:hypothetical protein